MAWEFNKRNEVYPTNRDDFRNERYILEDILSL